MRLFRLFSLMILNISVTCCLAQGKINGPVKVCLGNSANFSYTPPSGLTVNSISWNFGDGNTSTIATPSHNYAAKGKYTVRVSASLSNGSTGTDSLRLEVFGIPRVFFYPSVKNDTCLNRNNVCLIDTSSPAVSGQTLTRRTFIWGDGTFKTQLNPVKGDSFCHQYQVADIYTVRVELTDKEGCVNSATRNIKIVQTINVGADIRKSFINCNTARLCMRNKSTGAPHNQTRYRWYADTSALDTNVYATSDKCIPYPASRSGKITLIAWTDPVCKDTLVENFDIVIDPMPTKMTLQDTVVCHSYDGLNLASFTNISRDNTNWYVNNQLNPLNKANENYFSTRLPPARYPVRVEIVRGSCVITLRDTFRVMGPQARFDIIDGKQCFSSRDVFMIDRSAGIDRNRCTFRWTLSDPQGEKCVQQRMKDINKYKNCNVSLDWFNKHRFSKSSGQAKVHLLVTDTVSGCVDSSYQYVNMEYCSPLLSKDTIPVCVNRYFVENSLPPYPKWVSLDSGSTWHLFPYLVDTTHSGHYKMSYIFDTEVPKWAEHFGDDSFKQHTDTVTYFDTLINYNILRVNPIRKDNITWKVYGTCRPFRLSVYFGNKYFRKGESLEVFWTDKNNVLLTFDRDTVIDSVFHVYEAPLIVRVTIITRSDQGCENYTRFDLELGKFLSVSTPKFINCSYDKVCFTPGVFDPRQRRFWSGNSPGNYVRWWFPDTPALVTRWNPCVKFDTGGLRPFKLFATDTFGCTDTLIDTIFIQDLRAGVRNSSMLAYCADLKQFFDSSQCNRNPKYRRFLSVPPWLYLDSIVRYSWQFGSGTFSSLQKNPVQVINTSLDSIPAALAVQTNSGCYDTVRFHIRVKGPKPWFRITDTVGCNSLQTWFVNRSRESRQYIWSFGDSVNSSEQKSDTSLTSFLYKKPGRYHIRLTAADSVYNPFTQRTRYCVSTFPDPVYGRDTWRSVIVLPVRKTGIGAPDTICLGTPAAFLSLSDTAYLNDRWNMGDSSLRIRRAGDSLIHVYLKEGNYTIKLNPYYDSIPDDYCRDSAMHTLTVLNVKAAFSTDPQSKAPLFRFLNGTVPVSAGYLWDFGVNGASSTELNPEWNYGNDTGTYRVCLIASLPFGCRDTVCTDVYNDYLTGFGLYNVFTPGKKDNLNDVWDVVIEGEELYQLQIFNRWGETVYNADRDYDMNDPGNWNGTVMNTGAECPAGTYYYVFTYRLRSNPSETKTVQGVIRLIR